VKTRLPLDTNALIILSDVWKKAVRMPWTGMSLHEVPCWRKIASAPGAFSRIA